MRKQLQEKKNDLITRAEEIVNTAEAETRELTDDEAQELAEIRDDVRKIKERLGLLDDISDLDREKKGAKANECRDEEEKEGEGEDDGADEKAKEEAETRAFEAYVRGLAMNERDDNTPLSKGQNGEIIPVTIAKRIIRKLYEISPILDKSTKYNIRGTLAIPYYEEDGTNFINVAFQGPEFTKISANSGKFTSKTLTGYTVGALTLISRTLINNVDFPIVDYVVEQMAYSYKRFFEGVLINGSGAITGQTGTVEGLTGVTQAITAASATAITSNELIELQDSIIDVYQNNAVWLMSRKTRTAIRELKDNMGRYLLQDDISLPFGKSLLGHPIFVSDNMPEMEAGKPAVYYGDLAGLATKLTKDMEIQILREKYADQHADGIIGWADGFDAKVQNAQMLSKLVMAGGSASY